IGNFHKKKGTYDLLSLLKDHYVLHTSGYKGQQIEGLINHSRLSYPDYLKLLSDMDVCITYSRFREGWCRTAHEALILGTKVIGSGYGGMGELLKGSSQPIASDYLSLKIALENYDLFEIDSDYVTSFDFERFKKSWSELVEKL
ncbi:TPA: glycosyltransferase, partial [Escherichia coli]|nr:glycosyltransferase [Escherichia coli]